MKVFVYGSGSWGTALANVLCDNGHDVVVFGRSQDVVNEINNDHTNSRYFENVKLNEKLAAVNDLALINEADTVLLAVPSRSCTEVAAQISSLMKKPFILLNVAKGFEPKTYNRLSKEIIKLFDKGVLKGYAALLGPSHAEEVVQRKLTAINVVGEDDEICCMLQRAFANDYFRVYRNNDLIGCEYAAGLKNIIAVASGILYGLNLGDNAKAALMTRGLAEMSRYGIAHGASAETFLGLCGMGDLIVTCTSKFSRNWQAGYTIGLHDDAQVFWDTNTKTVEGVDACRIIYNRSRMENISMPITEELYHILYEGCKPSQAAARLMKRALKQE